MNFEPEREHLLIPVKYPGPINKGVPTFYSHRTPRAICDVINALRLTPEPVNPRSPWAGELPALHVFQNASSGQSRWLTESAVDSLVSKGIALIGIVALSWHGLKSSARFWRIRVWGVMT